MYPAPLFKLFGQGVYLYGLLIGLGIIACLIVFFFYTKKKGMPEDVQDFVFIVAIIAIALGFLIAKLYQAIYDWIETGTFDFYGAGITAMGGFVGGAAVFLVAYFVGGKLFFKGKKQDLHKKWFNTIFLVAPICILIAHAFGRIGCSMAGCCHGNFVSNTYVFGTIPRYSYNDATGALTLLGYYVPVQLYEATFLFLAFGVLTYLFFHRCNITMPIYMISYGIWRIVIEFFRTDARGAVILGLYPSQWQSIIFIVGGIAIIVFYIVKKIPLFFPKNK